ncbi:MAG: PAS domain S-box protein [Promethearchaeota archaeon]
MQGDDLCKAIPTPIYMRNADGRFEKCNNTFEDFFGIREEDLLGKGPRDVFDPNLSDVFLDLDRGLERDPRGVQVYNGRVKSGTGDFRDIILEQKGLTDEAGALEGSIGFIFDITRQKEAERQLRKSRRKTRRERDRIQNYLDVAGVIIVALDRDSKVTLINKKGCEVLGYQEDEIVGENWFEKFIPPAHRDSNKKIHERLLRGEFEGLETVENPVLTRDGEVRTIRWKNALVRKRTGSILGTLSSGEDTTELNRAKDELAVFRDAIESTRFGIGIASLDRRLKYLNPHLERLLGTTTRGDYVGRDFLEFYQKDVRNRLESEILPQVLKEGHWTGELTVSTTHSEEIPTIHNIVLANGKSYAFTVVDISERKAAEDRLSLLSSVVEQSPNIIVVTDTGGTIEYANPAFTRITGYSLEESVGRDMSFLAFDPDDEQEELWRTISTGKVWRGTFHNKKKDGSDYWETAVVTPFRDQSGQITNYLKVAEDITLQLKIEEKNLRQTTTLEGINRILRQSPALESEREVVEMSLEVLAGLTGCTYGVVFDRPLGKEPQVLGYWAGPKWVGVEDIGEFNAKLFSGYLKEVFKNDKMTVRELVRGEIGVKGAGKGAGKGSGEAGSAPLELFFAETPKTTTYLVAAPIGSTAGTIGVLGLLKVGGPLTVEDRTTIETVSVAFAEALTSKRAELERERILFEITIRNQISDVFLKIPDDGIYAELLNLIIGALRAQSGLFGLVNESGELYCPALVETTPDRSQELKTAMTFCRDEFRRLWERAIRERTIVYSDTEAATTAAPILYQDRAIGLVEVERFGEPFRPKDRQLLEFFTVAISPLLVERFQREREEAALVRTTEELERVRDDLRRLIDTANAPIYGVDTEGRVNEWNLKMAELTGWTKDEAIGRAFVDTWIPDELQDETRAVIERALAGEVTTNFQVELESRESKNAGKKTGERTQLLISTTPRRDERGNVVGVVHVGQDITELNRYRHHLEEVVKERTNELSFAVESLEREIERRTEVEADLRKTIEVAQAASRAKSDFLANMSHELRTPLNSIIGFSEVLVDEIPGPIVEEQKVLLERIIESSHHLLDLINDVLDLSRVEAGKLDLELSEFSLRELVSSCLKILEEQARKKKIETSESYNAAKERVVADELRVKQVLINLLGNAIKFTPDGGKVGVEVEDAEGKDGFLQVTVWDTGIGIAASDQHKLFSPFQQLENPYTKKYQGTGLGLHFTRKFVELHGGEIWVESEEGKGSKFKFTLPLVTRKRKRKVGSEGEPGD